MHLTRTDIKQVTAINFKTLKVYYKLRMSRFLYDKDIMIISMCTHSGKIGLSGIHNMANF